MVAPEMWPVSSAIPSARVHKDIRTVCLSVDTYLNPLSPSKYILVYVSTLGRMGVVYTHQTFTYLSTGLISMQFFEICKAIPYKSFDTNR